MGIWEVNMIELIKAGGPLMIPIILCSVFALAIVIEKIIYFKKVDTNIPKFKKEVFDLLKVNNVKQAMALCEANPSSIAKILKAGIGKLGSSQNEIKEAMEDASLFEIPKLESRLTALSTIAQVSPLLGLLGTVTGMTSSFRTIQVQSNAMNPVTPGDLAGGIWEALITTVAGLFVAIPAFVLHSYCVSRVNHVILGMEHAATELLNFTQSTQDASFSSDEVKS